MKRLLLVLLCCWCLVTISALGVTPGKALYEYNGGGTMFTGSVKILNDDAKERDLVLQTQGELGSAITLNERRVTFTSADTEQIVTYTVTVPQGLAPGRHTGDIVIREEQAGSDDDDVVGAVLSVVSQVEVYVPYPGKYATATLRITSAAPQEPVTILIPILNQGEFDLVSVYATIDIYTEFGEKIDTITTSTVGIQSQHKYDLVTLWDEGAPIGRYTARATLVYDGETLPLEAQFEIGNATLELEALTVNNFVLGQIAKIDMLVKNNWFEDFTDVYTETKIFGASDNLLATFNSPTTAIEAQEKKVLSSFWDTAGVNEGTYDTTILIHYAGGKTIETDVQLIVRSDSLTVIGLGYVLSEGESGEGASDTLLMILIIVIGVLILLNVIWFMVLRRMMQKKTKK